MAAIGQPPLAPPSPAPPGWQRTWSEQHNQWYYVDIATGFSQWEHPTGAANTTQPDAAQHSVQQYPGQNQPNQQEFESNQGDTQSEASRGLGSMAAGAFLGHEMHKHSSHDHHHHDIFGTMATFVGGAGVGALGAKLFGGKKQPQPQQQPTHHASSTPSYSPPPFQGYSAHPQQQPYSPGPGHYAMGAGAAAGVATMAGMHAASNYAPHHYQQPVPSPPVQAASSGMGSFSGNPVNSGPVLIIHAAAFADKDVTQRVRSLVNADQKISIQKKLVEEFGDPWPEAGRKGLSILYQYGNRPMEVWAGDTTDEVVAIKNEPLSNEKMSFVNKKPGRIVCLIWGEESVMSDERLEKLEKDGELDCKDLGKGNWWAWEQRTLICYYRGPQGNIQIAHAREGGTLRLPWNPLAQWS